MTPLQVALAAPRPIRDAFGPPHHEPPAWHCDPDELAADPAVVERYGRQRKEKETRRVLEILDSLERSRA